MPWAAERCVRLTRRSILPGICYALEQLPQPLDQAALFGRTAPLEIEVGCGKGLFLSAAAAGDPHANFLGIEILAKYARFTAARLAQRELPYARIIQGDAQHLFRAWLEGNSARAVHVYFPDPWWKARHKKRRVMNESFLADVERVLIPGGTLHFWTDVEDYFARRWKRSPRPPGSAAHTRSPKNRPTTISTTARTSSAACDCTTSRYIGRSSARKGMPVRDDCR